MIITDKSLLDSIDREESLRDKSAEEAANKYVEDKEEKTCLVVTLNKEHKGMVSKIGNSLELLGASIKALDTSRGIGRGKISVFTPSAFQITAFNLPVHEKWLMITTRPAMCRYVGMNDNEVIGMLSYIVDGLTHRTM